VQPGQIVGALANEGGLARGDFGRIQIRDDFSLIELPARLPAGALDRLAGTRIGGKPIDIKADRGPAPRGKGWEDRGGSRGGGRGYDRDDRPRRDDRGGSERRGSDRGDRNDRGGNDYGRNDRGDRGGYDRGDRGGYDRGDRGGYDRNDRGGYDRNDRGDRGGYGDRGRDNGGRGGYDRGGNRGGSDDRGRGNDRGGYGDRDTGNRDTGRDRADGKRKPRW
jgi:ATP-dependent RNA helicase DeaD